MNNAATRMGGGASASLEDWHQAMDVNFWGLVHGLCAFLQRMLEQGSPSLVINTGSKQGITNPPGNLACNVTNSALRSYTEGCSTICALLRAAASRHICWSPAGRRPAR